MIPAYNDVLRELNIELIDTKNHQKCNSNLVKFKNEGLKIQKLSNIKKALPKSKNIRFRGGFWFITFHTPKVRITPNSLKYGGYSS